MVENHLDEQHQIIEESPKETTVSISKTAYLIQAAAIFLARKLGASFSLLYMAGKLANLLTYAFLCIRPCGLFQGGNRKPQRWH